MTAPPTDEQVAHAVADYDDVTVTNALAREVQAYRALRPDCPTCEGEQVLHEERVHGGGEACEMIVGHCGDCTDGKMPLDKWVALLVETLAAARSDMEGWAAYASDYFTAKHNLAGDLASVDAVLKMVPKVSE